MKWKNSRTTCHALGGVNRKLLLTHYTITVEETGKFVSPIPNGNGQGNGAGGCKQPHVSAGIRGEREERDRRERERLVRALAQTQGNKAEAARALGLARSTLVSRLKKYGLS